jgi:hypothetical protein
MDITIELSELRETDRAKLEGLVPGAEIYHSTGVVGGDPLWVIAISTAAAAVATVSGGLAKLLHEWQQRGIQRRVQFKITGRSTQWDFKGMSVEEIDRLLTREFERRGEDDGDGE